MDNFNPDKSNNIRTYTNNIMHLLEEYRREKQIQIKSKLIKIQVLKI